MKESIKVSWAEGLSFAGEVDGHPIVMDAKEDVGGKDKGPRPKPLMMVALAGCTGMDVISILNKMRVEVADFQIEVEGDITEEHPKHFTQMHIIYRFKGENLDRSKLEKAVDLSQERYCGVSESYRKAMKISHEIVIES